MRFVLLTLTLGLAFVGNSGSTASAMQLAGKPSFAPLAQPATCHGNRRNYRNFGHCWRVNRAARYCSRICAK